MSNKTSDKNVGSIEDDVKEIKESIEEAYRCYEYDLDYNPFSKGIAEIIERILADYTRQKEMNEEHQKINGELRERVKELEKYTIHLTDEEFRKVIENAQMDTSNDRVIAHRFAVMQQQINEKDKRIQELEAKNKYLESLSECQHDYLLNSIPTQKVIDKTEYLKRQRRELGFKTYLKREDMLNDDRILVCEIQVLQELLETK